MSKLYILLSIQKRSWGYPSSHSRSLTASDLNNLSRDGGYLGIIQNIQKRVDKLTVVHGVLYTWPLFVKTLKSINTFTKILWLTMV